jgi:mannose-6-phosphate isomerase-like protein (cupin superfamily)
MTEFATMILPEDVTVVAPDGGDVRVLLALASGSFAHFALDPGKTSKAVAHRSVEEIWYVVSGLGEMWRRQGEREQIVKLQPGVCLTIPLGTHFQFRSLGPEALAAVAITMPPWPTDREEAYTVEGRWQANL